MEMLLLTCITVLVMVRENECFWDGELHVCMKYVYTENGVFALLTP